MFRKLLPVLVILALPVMACGFQVNLPSVITPGPTVTDQIDVPLHGDTSQAVDLSIAFGAGTLKVHPGASNLVSGTAAYNFPDFKPVVTVNDSQVRIEQGNWKMKGITDFSKIKNDWDLSLGSQALDLSVEAGGYQAEYELGGLALTNINVKDGASDVKMSFASPNPAEMSLFRYETGASNLRLEGLGNANFANLTFKGGAGNFTLDFSGTLKRAGSVNIETGLSNTTLIIPSGIPVQLTVDGGLSNVSHDSTWSKNGDVYTRPGSGPQLTILVKIGAGNLTLTD
jgi:hypothetical protein